MKVIKVPLSDVLPWDKNPRGIKQKDFDRLKKQILKLGEYKPLVVFEKDGKYVVLGGNMRLRAYQDLGLKDVSISIVEAPTNARQIEYAMSDNDRAGYYEEDALAELVYPEIANLDLGAFKVDLGESIDLKQVVERYGPDLDDGADDVPEVDDTPAVTKMGDLFTLGRHRLLCGDSTKAEDVARLMRGEKAGLLATDPPYGVSYADKNKFLNAIWRANRIQEPIENDHQTPAEMSDLWVAAFTKIRTHMGEGASYYVTGPQGGDLLLLLLLALKESDFPLRHMLIWRKNQFVIGRSDYHYQHEPIIYGWVDGAHSFYGGRGEASVWEIDKPHVSDLHPTMKPIALFEKAIKNSSADGQVVLDPFLGSGTTLIAAEKTGRVCYGMEIDPKYCDVIIKRYADYAKVSEDGIRATRETA